MTSFDFSNQKISIVWETYENQLKKLEKPDLDILRYGTFNFRDWKIKKIDVAHKELIDKPKRKREIDDAVRIITERQYLFSALFNSGTK